MGSFTTYCSNRGLLSRTEWVKVQPWTNLLFMQHHLTVKGAPEGSHCDKWLPNSTDGPGEDVVELHAVDGVPALLHGVQGHRVTSGHVDGICETNPHNTEC